MRLLVLLCALAMPLVAFLSQRGLFGPGEPAAGAARTSATALPTLCCSMPASSRSTRFKGLRVIDWA